MKILTIFENNPALSTPSGAIDVPNGLWEARRIAEELGEALVPLMPAAGLAAPQVGISKCVFIFSWNRSMDTMEAVINPQILAESAKKDVSWEACFSTFGENEILAAKVERPQSVDVQYINLQGETVRKRLVGFAAKVFMHEYDHLSGIENVRKPGVETRSFSNRAAFVEFMQTVKKHDSVTYQPPTILP